MGYNPFLFHRAFKIIFYGVNFEKDDDSRHTMKKQLFFFIALIAAAAASASCGKSAGLIDYSHNESWLALPGMSSPADMTPKGSGFSNLQQSAKVDVFYVHPTTGMREDVQNVPIDDPDALETGYIMLMSQATPFNGIARIFAPRYRQIALHVYDLGEETLQEPMNFAYKDVQRAFLHYIKYYNGGRPFFLVAHSQGSEHALRLISEEVQGTYMENRMVAAYLPGDPVPRSVFSNNLTRIPPCTYPEQTGCVAVWGTFGEEYEDFTEWESLNIFWDPMLARWRPAYGESLYNVNPVSWLDNKEQTPLNSHRGAVPFGAKATHFTKPVPRLVSVRSEQYSFVSPTPLPADLFNDGGVFGGANYHVFDINLFWVDIRENARLRLNNFLLKNDKAAYPLISCPAVVEAQAGQTLVIMPDVKNTPAIFNASGLPEGLSINQTTGVISGIPLQSGVSAAVITATNSAGSYTADIAITVTQ